MQSRLKFEFESLYANKESEKLNIQSALVTYVGTRKADGNKCQTSRHVYGKFLNTIWNRQEKAQFAAACDRTFTHC